MPSQPPRSATWPRPSTGRGGEDKPTIFVRFAAAQVGHEGTMLRPRESNSLDYEGEIALIIGNPGRRIAKDNWLAHIAGFSCYNDGSVRDYQFHTSQFTVGKNFAATGGFGPWMVTLTKSQISTPSRSPRDSTAR